MSRCEDYPCCGHGPAGDGGGCPTVEEKACGCGEGCEECDGTGTVEVTLWNCVECGKLFKPTSSSICPSCLDNMKWEDYD